MATDRTHFNQTEEEWIAKYRAALKEIPVQPSRSTKVRDALNRAHSTTISRISRMFARPLDPSRWEKTAQPSEPTRGSRAQGSTRDLAESNVKVA
jgi:hypothetical protein